MEHGPQIHWISNYPQGHIEIQAQAQSSDEIADFAAVEAPSLLVMLLSFLPTLIFFGLMYLYFSSQKKRTNAVLETANRNTTAIEANNELLRENIQLQKKLIEEMHNSRDAQTL